MIASDNTPITSPEENNSVSFASTFMEDLITTTLEELLLKVRSFRKACHKTTTVALGSSHGGYGFDPHLIPGSFNFCTVSQDLKHSSLLYKWIINFSDIKTLILFYSIFSPGFSLEESSAKLRCVAYKKIFDFDVVYDDEIESHIRQLNPEALRYNLEKEPELGFFRSNDCFFYKDDQGIEQRASVHVKHAMRNSEPVFLKEVLSIAQSLSHEVVIVVPPARSDYHDFCKETFDTVYKNLIVETKEYSSNCTVLNLFNSSDFLDSYFGDGDHLLPEGPGTELVTCKIRDVLHIPEAQKVVVP